MIELIKLEQHPVISHALREMGENVTNRINDLNIANQIATEDCIKSMKSLRAELNKEAKEFEEQRKFVKEAILKPYSDFEDIYKAEIISKYREADELLKTKITEFEMKIKTDKRNVLIVYFNEICEMEQIDWLSFDRLGIEVNLSTSEKKYKEEIYDKISGILNDIELIKTDEYQAEILVEYKKTLKVSQAIQDVRGRKEAEKREKARIKLERTQKRVAQLHSILFIFHDLTRTYNWANDQSVMITLSEIEEMTDDDWFARYAEIESQTKPQKTASLQSPAVEPIKKPEPQKTEEQIFTAAFEVYGTYSELKKLQEFLKSNNYNYKNI